MTRRNNFDIIHQVSYVHLDQSLHIQLEILLVSYN